MKGLNCQSALDAFQELTLKDEQRLEAVLQRIEDGCRGLVALKFSAGVMTFAADADTDEVEVRFQEFETFDPTGLDSRRRGRPMVVPDRPTLRLGLGRGQSAGISGRSFVEFWRP